MRHQDLLLSKTHGQPKNVEVSLKMSSEHRYQKVKYPLVYLLYMSLF
jgi:hypothetical protein